MHITGGFKAFKFSKIYLQLYYPVITKSRGISIDLGAIRLSWDKYKPGFGIEIFGLGFGIAPRKGMYVLDQKL